MDAFRIQGGKRLTGHVSVDGSKNAALPLMAAALLADEPVVLHRVPALSDITNMTRLLEELGCPVTRDGEQLSLSSLDHSLTHARYDIVRTMRASICVLGPLLARRGHARVSMPGGCAFGARPIDLHLKGLRALGAEIELQGGDIIATADRLRGTTIFLGGAFGSTVLGTANVMSAATLAEGTTVIESAACEPEVVDVARLLNAMGAKISGAGSPRIVIEGVEQLGGAVHDVIPDRIAGGTYALAAAISDGDVTFTDFPHENLLAFVDCLDQVGVDIQRTNPAQDPRACTVRVTRRQTGLEPVILTTQPYPGFPTDLQAQMLALLCFARGNSIVTEKIYPERFLHVAELTRMGANLFRQGPTVVVQGVKKLIGAPVMASDLRASASLVLAGLAGEGTTTISRVYHLDRGYASMEKVLIALGAEIERFNPERDLSEEIADGATTPASESPVVTTLPTKPVKTE